jgi:hypothetical protein
MAAITCKYHITTPARWVCQHCQINFCANCIDPPKNNRPPPCPVCKAELTSLGTGNLVAPFWQRLGKFFIYPAYPGPLMLMFTLTAISFALVNISIPLFSILCLFIVGVVFMKYAYVVLEDTAHGHLVPRSITSDVLTEQIILPLKQIALMFALGAVQFTIFDIFGGVIAWLVYAITVLALPASTMVLAM